MLDKLTFRLIRHGESTDDLNKQIAVIKSFHWHYPIEEHLRWMKENIKENDYHLLLLCEDEIVAYMNLVNRKVEISGEELLFLGIGNVCVHREYLSHKLGILLMDICKFYLGTLKLPGILFCKDSLIPFYSKAGWSQYKGTVVCNSAGLKCKTFLSTSAYSDAAAIKIDSTF